MKALAAIIVAFAFIAGMCAMLTGCTVTRYADGSTSFSANGQQIARAIQILSDK